MEGQIALSETLRIVTIDSEWAPVKKALLQERGKDSPVIIDLRAVQKMDSSGLQLILFLLHYQQEFPGQLKLTGVGDSLIRTFEEHGYTYRNKEEEGL